MITLSATESTLVEGVLAAYPDSDATPFVILSAIEALEAMAIEPTVVTIAIWIDGYWAGYDVAY